MVVVQEAEAVFGWACLALSGWALGLPSLPTGHPEQVATVAAGLVGQCGSRQAAEWREVEPSEPTEVQGQVLAGLLDQEAVSLFTTEVGGCSWSPCCKPLVVVGLARLASLAPPGRCTCLIRKRDKASWCWTMTAFNPDPQ